MKQKFVLAYSGGLDTSIIIPWLKENYDCEVIAVAGDVGQNEDLSGLHDKAIKTGAEKIFVEDLKHEFVTEYIFPMLKALPVYEGQYLLGTSIARPCIAKRLVEIALREGATAIAHGCTGKGNDQVRFELTAKALAPQLKVVAPWRIWNIKSRKEEIQYAKDHGIPLSFREEESYSADANIWHISHEGLDLEDPRNMPNYDTLLQMTTPVTKAPDAITYVTINFDKGIPTHIDGVETEPVALMRKLNQLGGDNGIGIIDMVENRLVGMKSRGVYETPGGTILYKALSFLQMLTLDRATLHYKEQVALRFAELVYDGLWFTPIREGISAFMDSVMSTATGSVKLALYKGNITLAGMDSPYSLYDESIATFDEDDVYDQKDSEGFINLFGLPLKVQGQLRNKK